MIYVYVNSKRMAYLQQKIGAAVLSDESSLEKDDTIVLPILSNKLTSIPLIKSFLKLSTLHQLKIFLPFPHPLIPNDNTFFYYMKDEQLVTNNADLTALGLLFYLTQHALSLYEIQIDIIGGGKCGKALANLLFLLGVEYRIIHHLGEDNDSIEAYKKQNKGEVIVNTAPVCYLSLENLQESNTKWIIDISSEKCYPKSLEKSGVEIIHPGSLPEKYFPCSGADLICNFMRRVLDEK